MAKLAKGAMTRTSVSAARKLRKIFEKEEIFVSNAPPQRSALHVSKKGVPRPRGGHVG
jgi:hypothetical protein